MASRFSGRFGVNGFPLIRHRVFRLVLCSDTVVVPFSRVIITNAWHFGQ